MVTRVRIGTCARVAYRDDTSGGRRPSHAKVPRTTSVRRRPFLRQQGNAIFSDRDTITMHKEVVFGPQDSVQSTENSAFLGVVPHVDHRANHRSPMRQIVLFCSIGQGDSGHASTATATDG